MSERFPLCLDWHRSQLALRHSLQWGPSEVPEPFTTTPHRRLPYKLLSAMHMQFPQLQLLLLQPLLPPVLQLLPPLLLLMAVFSK